MVYTELYSTQKGSPMSLKVRINDDMKAAMRAREAERLGAIRLLLAAIKQKEVDERVELDDAAIATVVDKLIKQRKDSIEQFQKGGREDLVAKEKEELAILESYLPQMLSREEIRVVAHARIEAIKAGGSFDPKAVGKIIGMIMKELAGQADGTDVKAVVDELLKA